MAKITGYVGAVPGILKRAQNVDLMGVGSYELDTPGRRDHGSYDGISQAGAGGYDLNQPGAVSEIKDVLVELARYFSDPTNRPNPATETIWKHIDRSVEFRDAWDGPTADEFSLMVGRLRHLDPVMGTPNYAQLKPIDFSGGKANIVGGPQPTVQGLELLAQAAHKYLKDEKQLHRYLAWRKGSLDDWFSGPPDTFVRQCHSRGRAWNPRGWTLAWRDGPVAKEQPGLLVQLDMTETSLATSWAIALHLTKEKQRTDRANYLTSSRLARHDIVKQLNAGAPEPVCSDPAEKWSSKDGSCVSRCPDPGTQWDSSARACAIVVDPGGGSLYSDYTGCLAAHLQEGFDAEAAKKFCLLEYPEDRRAGIGVVPVVAVATVVGLSAWWYLSRPVKG